MNRNLVPSDLHEVCLCDSRSFGLRSFSPGLRDRRLPAVVTICPILSLTPAAPMFPPTALQSAT